MPNRSIPAEPDPAAGKGGIVPPVETRWKPGESGNPAGRPCAGASMREWINQMAEWTAGELKAAIDDATAPAAKRAAARVWFDAASTSLNAAGNPIAGAEFDRIMDRTEGKPKQAMTVDGNLLPHAVEIITPLTRRRDGAPTDERRPV